MQATGSGSLGSVMVHTTNNGGHSPEFWAQRLADQMMQIADTAPVPIRDQAQAFKDRIYGLSLRYISEAIRSDRATLCTKLNQSGMTQVAEAIKGM